MKQFNRWAVAALTVAAVTTSSWATHSWNGYHWARTTSTFTLKVVDSTTPDWDGELNDTLAAWAQSGVFNFTIAASDDGSRTRKRCNMVPGQMRVCNAAYGQNGWLGLASIGLDSQGHIDQGTAKMNDSYSSYWTPEEKNHVMCQEVGHVLGLGHTSEDGSSQKTCMDYSTDPQSQWPNAHDYQMLQDIYAHLDSYNSYDDGSGSGGGSCKNPRKCKRGVGFDGPKGFKIKGDAHHEVWIQARDDGGMWVHHVWLAPSKK
jgi:hypothetical protein